MRPLRQEVTFAPPPESRRGIETESDWGSSVAANLAQFHGPVQSSNRFPRARRPADETPRYRFAPSFQKWHLQGTAGHVEWGEPRTTGGSPSRSRGGR